MPEQIAYIARDYEFSITLENIDGTPRTLPGGAAFRFVVMQQGQAPVIDIVPTVGSLSPARIDIAVAAADVDFAANYYIAELYRTDTGADDVVRWSVEFLPPGRYRPGNSSIFSSPFVVRDRNMVIRAGAPVGPQGAQGVQGIQGVPGSNGLMSTTEVQRGIAALEMLTAAQRGRKAMVLDLVGGGYAHVDEDSGHELRSIESIPSITLTNSTGGIRLSRKRLLETVGANALRYDHDVNGVPQGVLFEAAHSYTNRQTQPGAGEWGIAGADYSLVAAPAGWTGDWWELPNGAVASTQVLYEVTGSAVIGQDYYMAALIQMLDGTAPVGGTSTSSGDFLFFASGSTGLQKKPSDGSPGYDVIGPLANNVYLVQCCYTATIANGRPFALARYTGQGARGFRVGPHWSGPGPKPASLFDNATATPNSRAADVLKVPLSGFNTDGLTLAVEATLPAGVTAGAVLAQARLDANNLFRVTALSATSVRATLRLAGTDTNIDVAGITSGVSRRFAFAVDGVLMQLRGKAQGVAAPSPVSLATAPSFNPASLNVGSNDGTSDWLGGDIALVAVADRPWTAAEIAAFTG